MVGLAVLSTAQAATATGAARDAGRARTVALTATSAVVFVHELEREVSETTALRQRGGKSGSALMVAQRERTDAAARRYLADSRKAVGAVPALGPAIRTANELYGRLGSTREAAENGAPVSLVSDPVYRGLAEALLAIADAVPAQIEDIELANAARAVAAIAAVEHYAALERDLLRTVFSRGSLEPGELGTLSEIRGAREQRQAEFRRAATAAEARAFDNEMRGSDVDNAGKMSAAARDAERNPGGLKVDADAWFVAQSGVIRRLNLVGFDLSDRLDLHAEEIAINASRRAWATGIGTAVLGLAALAIAIALAVRTARRLRRLRGAALQVARRDLPDAINSVITGSAAPSTTESGQSAAAVTRGIAATNDEIGQVADAFATVHRTALRLAGEQAELRVDVTRMAEVLARRIRTLITRQLRLLDEFERDETDPDVLARLFALDHLAARLRRNGENLLVLAGGEPGRPATQAVQIGAVVAAAASEIEDFHRVEVQPAELAITGPVVGDLVHLLAELLENATTFSPPTQPVRVDARATVDGAMIRVHDSGIGIMPARLAEINSRLSVPSTLSSAAAGTMGLHVVSHLAARHGIRVQLHATGSGTVAYVTLPHRILELMSALPAARPAARQEPERQEPVHVPSTVGAPLGRPRSAPQPQPVTIPAAAAAASRPAAPWFRPYLSSGTTPTPPPAQPTWGPPGEWPPRPGNPSSAGGGPMTEENLPRRRPGAQLAPGTTEQPPPTSRGGAVDPELIRSRLTAFAEGVSAAARRTNSAAPGQKDQ
ncbi:sensor histidine kinase [Dactylosporangium fulvum]|uniref:histidine kinase n=1 Tax=Dactylosporangium fulvum TaxID=53359 RepID=A0ABY5VXR1_9ACTN|nr:sensor histidine kinase [Dactylosporangium fulvum]UWP82488.1 sensor histidine kinase [Dactylosporangium fulvum]